MNHQPVTLRPAEYSRTVYSHAVPEGNDFEKDVLDAKYWVHVANMLKPGDRIEVIGPGRAYFAELYVSTVNDLGAKVVPLVKVVIKENVESASGEELDDPDYSVKLRGPQRWSIIRKADGKVIQEQIPTRADAVKALGELRSAVAA